MLRNYFMTAWRNLLRNKFYSGLNISGLAIGLAVGIMILLWVQDELSYDRFHSKAERIFKINSHLGSGDGEQVWEGAPAPLAVMARQVPEIEATLRIADNWENPMYTWEDRKFTEAMKAFVDSTFFNVFDFKIIRGDRRKPFDGSHSVVLARSVADKFFGEADPIGKVLLEDGKSAFKVSAVMEDFPQNSNLQYGMLFPMSLYAERFRGNGEWKTIDEDLGNYFYKIFLLLKPGAEPNATAIKLSKVYERTRNYEAAGKSFSVQPLADLHLIAPDGNSSGMQRVRTFVLVALFTLIIACINYVNLSTARSILRSKEVSLRKIIGAGKQQLFLQFVFESAILFTISALLAFGLMNLLLPLYNQVSGKELVLNLGDKNVWVVLGTAICGSLILSSIYPAVLLSSFRPIEALKGKFTSGIGNAGFRKVLVVTQFVFSVVLIIATIVVSLQLKYVREKDLGYDRDHVLNFSLREPMFAHTDAIRNQLTKIKGVREVSYAGGNVVDISSSTGDTDWDGKDPQLTFLVNAIGIDNRFIPLFDMKMAAGKNFAGTKADSAHLILNESAVREAGINDPIGKRFTLWDTKGTIIGVVKDFNYASLRSKIEPAVFFYQPANYMVYIKTNGRDAASVIDAVRDLWLAYNPEFPFTYSFVDEQYDRLYKAEQRTGVLFNIFAVVAITISCLGLLGLATYTAQVKKREVGIRKVLGASVANITAMLAKSFLALVFISLFIAIPVAWWAMSYWLTDFAFRIDLSWWIFVAGGVIAIVIAFATVSLQAIRAALANPVASLKED